jgi:hypothetical protein
MRIHAFKVFHMPTLLAWNGIFGHPPLDLGHVMGIKVDSHI